MSGSWPRAWRLILARLHHDYHAGQLIGDEIGDCPTGWRAVAEYLAGITATEMVSTYGWDRAVDYTEDVIQCSLDAIARDQGDRK